MLKKKLRRKKNKIDRLGMKEWFIHDLLVIGQIILGLPVLVVVFVVSVESIRVVYKSSRYGVRLDWVLGGLLALFALRIKR